MFDPWYDLGNLLAGTMRAQVQHQAAFSLVELSIVLVILGLLTGGILAGQSLIRAAELRAIPTEYARYSAAFNTFRDKYFALPGDMIIATQFWGTATGAAACPGNNPTAARPDARTCNGDGDGRVVHVSAGGANQNEAYAAWQHLANAGLIEGSYSGVNNTVGSGVPYSAGVLGGFNVPSSKMSNAAWGTFTLGLVDPSGTGTIDGEYGNALMFGQRSSGALWPDGVPLKQDEAWNIDTKMDDGKPGSGKVVTAETHNIYCYRLADGSEPGMWSVVPLVGITYNLQPSQSYGGCSLYFKNAY